MAEFKLDRIRFRWKSDWQISTQYIKDDIVIYAGKAYVCLVTHNSSGSNFYSDLNDSVVKWELMFDGFTWSGDWQTTRFYSLGEVVKYNGFVYQCIDPHNSTPVESLGLDQDIEKWTLIATTYNWLDTWASDIPYNLGDVVTYNGITYICTEKHRSKTVSEGLESDQEKWNIVSRSDSWTSDWNVNTRYRVDDITKYGGIVYRCIEGHTSSDNITDGLEADLSKWEVVVSGIEYKFDWIAEDTSPGEETPGVRYKLNDIVKYGHALWICTEYHTSSELFTDNEDKWNVWLPGLGYERVWSEFLNYKKGDIVLYGGYTYTALQNNVNSIPSVNGILQDTGDWELLKEGYRHRGEWDISVQYFTGDVIRNNGYLYIAIADSLGEYPDTETSWKILVTGTQWRAEWQDNTTYYLGDIATFASTAYYCIQRHVSTSSDSRPDIDLQQDDQDYWIMFAPGTTGNVLTTLGDIRTHDDTETVRLAIGELGNNLKSIDSNPTWENFEETNKVYFVSTNGTDSVNNGKTINSPFRTIKYACDFILQNEAERAPATIIIKTGIYEEQLPISVPANVALTGDELRSTVVQPALGFELTNMFYVRNGSGIRNMTLQGLAGTLGSELTEYGTRRPTAGAYVSLDPGNGPDDESVWITSKSCYVQNVTTFGTGCIGMKIDGELHNGGNRSIVANDFTQVLSDGIGYWANAEGLSELVSVFTYYCYIGYLATNGGKLRATNGNNSYGTFGSRAEGFNPSESPIVAEIDNRTLESQVEVVHTNGFNLLAFGYTHAGQEYSSASVGISGAGFGQSIAYTEFRNDAISQIRLITPEDSTIEGGLNYQSLLNNAQGGTDDTLILAQADTNESEDNYLGLRVFIEAGKGVGQIGYISGYDPLTKVADVSRDSDDGPGWDHVYPGYPIESTLDSTTRYRIETRTVVDDPGFTVASVNGPNADTWQFITYGDKFVAVSDGTSGTAYTSTSNDGATWTSAVDIGTDIISGIVYTGSKYVIAKKETSGAGTIDEILQSTDGINWTAITLPDTQFWTDIASDGAGNVIIIGGDSQVVAVSDDNGDTWSAESVGAGSESWSLASYGFGRFIFVDTATGNVAYSTDNGANWTTTSAALTPGVDWNDVAYGNGRFALISATDNITAISFDGITWHESSIGTGNFDRISYGAGVFLVSGTGTDLAKSQDGKVYRTFDDDSTLYQTSQSGSWTGSAYGDGITVLLQTGSAVWNTITTGARALVRSSVESSRIADFIIYDPGSNYASEPEITLIDSRNTAESLYDVRLNSGVLAQPEFRNRGDGYITASATITGDGFADIFQTGNRLSIKNLSRIPGPGDNLDIDGIDDVTYRVVAVDSSSGSEPNFSANIRISPSIGNQESPIHETDITIRQQYSQVRLTGHDFLDIGTGNFSSTRYPLLYVEGFESENEPLQFNEVTEIGGGRVFYTSTDQDGNFRVGELFRVEQTTGIVTVNAEFFDLDGLTELSLGGIQVGGTSVIIREFSRDPNFVANSNNIVPTQAAIIKFLESRISSGGSDAITNTLIAGQVRVSGSNISTTSGFKINIPVAVNHLAGVEGDYAQLQYFTFGQRVGL